MPSVDGPLMYRRSVLLMALVASHGGVSAGQWYGGYGPARSSSQDSSDYYQDMGSAFIDGSGNAVYGVPSTRGYRFREIESTPGPESNLPKYRPSSFAGKSPYAWGAPSSQGPEGYNGPAPVFRPLEPRELGKSNHRDFRNRVDRFGYQGLPPNDQADHGTGGSDYNPDSRWAPRW
jgi:hypothetical protein